MKKRQLYSSPNGDRWFLARDPASGNVFVRHEANAPSGGHVTEVGIGEFLSRGQRHPEHEALLGLIGTLVKVNSDGQVSDRRVPFSVSGGRGFRQGDGRRLGCWRQ